MAWSDAARAAALEARRAKRRNEPYENTYYKVRKPMKVFEQTGYRGSNEYYGNSQIFKATYAERRLRKGDVIHSLIGGLFVVPKARSAKGVALPISLTGPSNKSAFERGSSDPSGDRYRQLVKLRLSRVVHKTTRAPKAKGYKRID